MNINIKETITKYGSFEQDTGSVKVQIALLSENIKLLTEHLNIHKKDINSRKGLITAVNKRKKLLKYMINNKKHRESYHKFIKTLGIRK